MGAGIRFSGRYQKKWLILLYFSLLLVLGWWAYDKEVHAWAEVVTRQVSRLVWEEFFALTEWSEDSLADIFAASIPLWPVADPEQEPILSGFGQVTGTKGAAAQEEKPASPVTARLGNWLGLQVGDPEAYIREAIPLFAYLPEPAPAAEPAESTGQPQSPAEPAPQPEAAGSEPLAKAASPEPKPVSEQGAPEVFIYSTHTGETYALTDKVVKVAGKRGGVYEVGKAIKARLESEYNIPVIQSDKIHDANWLRTNPYSESFKTVNSALQKDKSFKITMDVHRDAMVPRANTVVTINGQKVARIMLVVGTNARNNHPKWLENYRFAQAVGREMDKKYPGLLRKIMTKPGRYNMHLHPHALLVEIGSTENTTQEACLAGELLADVLAGVLQQKGN
ncbi:MAG TPA: stage II sporulation protein P [Bacillota bacterium]|nr:stage II sporulation protein P [Bacillota bacterium]